MCLWRASSQQGAAMIVDPAGRFTRVRIQSTSAGISGQQWQLSRRLPGAGRSQSVTFHALRCSRVVILVLMLVDQAQAHIQWQGLPRGERRLMADHAEGELRGCSPFPVIEPDGHDSSQASQGAPVVCFIR
jgi:hypothetical protein